MSDFTFNALSWFPGRCKVDFTESLKPLNLLKKDGSRTSLQEICKGVTPSCNLNPFLFHGHLQTIWTAMTFDGPQIHYKRRIFQAENATFKGHFAVDFVVAPPETYDTTAEDQHTQCRGLRTDPLGVGHVELPPRTTYFTNSEFKAIGSNDTKPLLLNLHGLAGGSHEVYLRQVLAALIKPTSGDKKTGITSSDWEALVIISRGCGGSKLTSGVIYNARATWDIRQVVKWARLTWPNRPLFAIGYSLGASILTNYLGEEGDKCVLSAALIISNPFNLDVGAKAFGRSLICMEVYSRTMASSMRDLVLLHKDSVFANEAIDLDKLLKARYLHEFDREVQCPMWGYPTEGAYYRDASSCDLVMSIRTPFFVIHAKDDPIAHNEGVPYEEMKRNPFIVVCTTNGGGHLGWFEWGGGRWYVKPVVSFLNKMWQHIDLSKHAVFHVDRNTLCSNRISPFAFAPVRRKAYVIDSDS